MVRINAPLLIPSIKRPPPGGVYSKHTIVEHLEQIKSVELRYLEQKFALSQLKEVKK